MLVRLAHSPAHSTPDCHLLFPRGFFRDRQTSTSSSRSHFHASAISVRAKPYYTVGKTLKQRKVPERASTEGYIASPEPPRERESWMITAQSKSLVMAIQSVMIRQIFLLGSLAADIWHKDLGHKRFSNGEERGKKEHPSQLSIPCLVSKLFPLLAQSSPDGQSRS